MSNKSNGLYLAAFLLCLNLNMQAHDVATNKKGVTLDDVMATLRQRNGDVVSVSSTKAAQKAVNEGEKKKVVGVVKDENGEPVIGATIRLKGTQGGAVTDIDGRFTLMAVEGDELEVSYIGYTTKSVRIGKADNYDISLSMANAKELNEVVVTALGIKREQKALSYNVQQVSSDALGTNKDANFINSLSGKVAGVNINASSSGAGGASKVVMRGTRSIEQSSNVLYVIDGVPMFNLGGTGDAIFGSNGTTEAIADINPEDIESMSVLTVQQPQRYMVTVLLMVLSLSQRRRERRDIRSLPSVRVLSSLQLSVFLSSRTVMARVVVCVMLVAIVIVGDVS